MYSFCESFRNIVAPYMEHVEAWYWGHEHCVKVYEPFTNSDGKTLMRGRLIGHGSKWKKAKNNQIPFRVIDHPKAREIGLCLLEISEDDCEARYMELSGEGDNVELVENYREEFNT